MGFSMGGAVALSAARDSAAIAAVVSDSGYASLQKIIEGALAERSIPRPLARLSAPLLLRYASLRLGINLTQYEPKRQVDSGFTCPLLAIQGDQDIYVPVGDIEALVRQSGGPAELWVVHGCGHREAREQYPKEYAERVLAFFERWLVEINE